MTRYARILGHLLSLNIFFIKEAKPLASGTTSQNSKLTTPIRTLTLAKDLFINIYTDIKYAYSIIYSKILVWKKMDFLDPNGTLIMNTIFIYNLLEAVLSSQATIIHC